MKRSPEAKSFQRRSRARPEPLSESAPRDDLRSRQERLLDEGLEETFPASDPVAVMRLT